MKLLLIDGHYYVYRSFFAIRGLSNSRGEPTNAIYGFVKTLRRMIKDLKPDIAAVIWDQGASERRVKLQPQYKQHRPEMPLEMVPQLDFIQKLAPLMGLQSLSLPNTEADDLMASYACHAVHEKMEVILATNDKGLFQLVADGVKVYSTSKADLPSPKDPFVLLDAGFVEKKWGVSPERIGDVLSLIGDTSDNIPGVHGLGPKNAAALINSFGGIDALLEGLDRVGNDRIREKLKEARARILDNREMVRLETDLDLPVPLEELKIRPNYPDLLEALERCEFKSLAGEVRAEAAKAAAETQGELFGP